MTADAHPDNDRGDAAEDATEQAADDIDLIEALRERDPVDIDKLPSSHSPEALSTLEQILGPIEDTQPTTGAPESEPSTTEAPENSPAAGDRGGREAPPPCPTSR